MVSIAHQLAVFGESFNGTVLPNRLISFDVVESLAVQNKIAAIDPTLAGFWFFVELSDVVSSEPDSSETSRGTDRRHGRQLSVRLMKSQQGCEIQIGNAVAVCQHKGLVLSEPVLKPLDASAGLGVQSSIDQVNFPVRLRAVVEGCFAGGEIQGDIIVQRVEIQKILLDDLLLVAKSDDKFVRRHGRCMCS